MLGAWSPHRDPATAASAGGRLRSAAVLVAPLVAMGFVLFLLGRAPVVPWLAALVLFVASLLAPAVPGRVRTAVGSGVALVGRAASLVLLTALFLVVVPVAWCLNRVAGIDLLSPPSRPRGTWSTPPPARPRDARRLAQPDIAPRHPVGRRAVRIVPVVLVAMALIWVGEREPAPWADVVGLPVSQDSFPGEPWGARVLDDQFPDVGGRTYIRQDARYGWVLHDYRSTTTNIDGANRRSLSVPDPVVTVWVFGGSVTLGIGQRDDHTIPSELVRLAATDGVRVQVVNFGVLAYANWQETQVFADALRDRPRPDLAIFLDGINDWYAAVERNNTGLLDLDEVVLRSASDAQRSQRAADAEARGYRSDHDLDRVADLLVPQYRAGVLLGTGIAAAAGVEVRYFWQPELATMPVDAPTVAEVFQNAGMDLANAEEEAAAYRRAMRASGVDPVDLTHVFDDVDRPIFFDSAHTNEAGARILAEAIYDEVEPSLRAAAG